MRGAGTGRVRPAKEAGWSCVGVLGSLSTPGDPAGLDWARSGREGNARVVRTHWSLPARGPGPEAQQALTGCSHSAGRSRGGRRSPKAACRCSRPPECQAGPHVPHWELFLFPLADLWGKALHSAQELTGAQCGH